MEIILGLGRLKRRLVKPVITLGNFDGVHLGHRKILRKAREEATRRGGEAVAITFEPHPLKVLSPRSCLPLLTPFRKKMALIEQTGMDVVLCLRFTHAFSRMSPSDFVRDILIKRLGATMIIVGYNYHFGKGKRGDAETLRRLAAPFDVPVNVMDPLRVKGTLVSSSRIRELIREGKMEVASRLLGRDYSIFGKVVKGARRGRRLLGFPTANLKITEKLCPRPGVYAVGVLWDNHSLNGVANVGSNPTFGYQPPVAPREISLEIYILDFDRDIYGQEIDVTFRRRIREEVRFDSPEQLAAQIEKDVAWARRNVFRK